MGVSETDSPIEFVHSPFPRRVQRGCPGVWLSIVIVRIFRVRDPCDSGVRSPSSSSEGKRMEYTHKIHRTGSDT